MNKPLELNEIYALSAIQKHYPNSVAKPWPHVTKQLRWFVEFVD